MGVRQIQHLFVGPPHNNAGGRRTRILIIDSASPNHGLAANIVRRPSNLALGRANEQRNSCACPSKAASYPQRNEQQPNNANTPIHRTPKKDSAFFYIYISKIE